MTKKRDIREASKEELAALLQWAEKEADEPAAQKRVKKKPDESKKLSEAGKAPEPDEEENAG